jgi:DNA mismatch endonuclease (patch repair protein)
MADNLSPSARSAMMSKIRSSNTAPELIVRKLLFARGLRYQLHRKDLPGKPDLVFPRFKAVILIHGCFWHMHGNGCYLSKRPSSNIEFWDTKLGKNKERDSRVAEQLRTMGWRVGTIWECSVRARKPEQLAELVDMIYLWLHSSAQTFETEAVQKGKK